MACPLCLSNSRFYREIKGYPLNKCEKCGHLFLENPANIHTQIELYEDRYFFGSQDGYVDYQENKGNLIEQGHWYADLMSHYCEPGYMLDIGAASGFILKGFSDRGWKGIGLEPNQHMVDYGNQNLGLKMEQGFLETYNSKQMFDLITMIQVVHHFYDVRLAFEKTQKMLKLQGFLLIETWKFDSLVAKLAGGRWHGFNPPTVRHWFTLKNLRDLVNRYGFEEVDHGRRHKKMRGHLLQAKVPKIFNRLIPKNMNIIYPGDDLFWILFKKTKAK